MARPAELVCHARRTAGLSQRELAAISGVPQASVARIERGVVIPRADTLERLLRGCGLTLAAVPTDDGIDRTLIRDRLAMTPSQRSRLGVQEARATLRLSRGTLRPAGTGRPTST